MSVDRPPWLTRAADELEELLGRIARLDTFLKAQAVAVEDADDLTAQLEAMRAYAGALERRAVRHTTALVDKDIAP